MSSKQDQAAPASRTAWIWPLTPLSNRYGTSVTEIMDSAADGRRVAVIEGAVWPAIGSDITVYEDEVHVRRGVVERVELVLGFRVPARVLVWAALVRDPA